MSDGCDVVGVPEMAARLGVSPQTPHAWLRRSVLPPAQHTVSGNAGWNWLGPDGLLRWAGMTGRIRNEATAAQYRTVFGEDPQPPRLGGPSQEPDGAAWAARAKPRRRNTRTIRVRRS